MFRSERIMESLVFVVGRVEGEIVDYLREEVSLSDC